MGDVQQFLGISSLWALVFSWFVSSKLIRVAVILLFRVSVVSPIRGCYVKGAYNSRVEYIGCGAIFKGDIIKNIQIGQN